MIEQISREFVPDVEEDANVCPVCHRPDRIEKVSSVVRRGSGLIDLPNLGGPQPFVSALAQALSPPELPRRTTYQEATVATIGSLIFGGLIALLVIGVSSIGALGIPDGPVRVALIATAVWFGLLIPFVSFARAAHGEKRAERLRPQLARARSRWEETYYCSRDDVVFLCHEEVVERPERMSELLLASPFRIREEGL